ncbi:MULTISPECIES: YebC/PmpR family DNA-binding transcriptional regulator [Candidatus Protochlamydia]|jgi:YebC/PmpR family DNA-binding regulatory protein|uniref:Probable transcriptional regulatory protein DB44_EC00440 n=1 Tax=Candidatus Protochlamydia amoebophila TaxID=362787 RepID=A0A0C1H8R3_9BACT|nr:MULTISPECIES: YebC/PmpR family DNA-binding transcriptional regulator [Protochlamydia]KIC71268.1 putative transcriptional regulatory protein [Candidatus Protochlamydia amoebophila]
MAGHSKWANIKHRKGKADAKKGKIFSRIAKEIISAVKLGGADQKNNPRLRLALQKARDANMPNENIDRNIKKASSADQEDYHEMTYELYGHGGVGIVVDVMTDNKNRISSDMRIATNKRGGTVATPGAVTFNFDRKGILQISKKNAIEEELFLAATEAGAEDFEVDNDVFIITTDPSHLYSVKDAINHLGFACEEAELEMIPRTYVECSVETAKDNLALIEWLEELEDVDAVYHNMKIPEELENE